MATVLVTTLVFFTWNLFTGHWFVIEYINLVCKIMNKI